ncbi:MAG: hypothetical protein ACI4K8_06895 [Candidatus Fimenecus sp.]
MFGEYMVYVNDKPILMVCDNTVFVKGNSFRFARRKRNRYAL